MKTRTKAMLLTLCAVLLVTASIMGTLAYLTSTDEVQNTFTVGKVNIELWEHEVDENGQTKKIYKDDGEYTDGSGKYSYSWVKSNSYKLLPGHNYDKDPTLVIKAGSESCYVRYKVTADFGKNLTEEQKEWVATFDIEDIICYPGVPVDRPVNDGWRKVNKVISEDGTSVTYDYRHCNPDPSQTYEIPFGATGDYDTWTIPLFSEIRIPATWTEKEMAIFENFKLNIVAEAIQADGFDPNDGAAIWAAFDSQYKTED